VCGRRAGARTAGRAAAGASTTASAGLEWAPAECVGGRVRADSDPQHLCGYLTLSDCAAKDWYYRLFAADLKQSGTMTRTPEAIDPLQVLR
jgi:hypothetical protein